MNYKQWFLEKFKTWSKSETYYYDLVLKALIKRKEIILIQN